MFDISKVPVGLRDLHNLHMTESFAGVPGSFDVCQNVATFQQISVEAGGATGRLLLEMVSVAFRMTYRGGGADGISGPRL